MTDLQFDIIDELYFVTSFKDLQDQLKFEESILKRELLSLISIGWVNYYTDLDGEQNPEQLAIQDNMTKLFFLASKKGLFAHNSK